MIIFELSPEQETGGFREDTKDMDQAKFFNEGDGFTQHNNMRVVAVEKGFCRCEADLGPHSMNIHGGGARGVSPLWGKTHRGGPGGPRRAAHRPVRGQGL